MADINRLPPPLTTNWDWQLAAACRGMDSAVFFHPPEERPAARNRRTAAAKQICHACPVHANCLSHALATREAYGIWGGMSESERADILGLRSLRFPGQKPVNDSTPAHPTTTPLRPPTMPNHAYFEEATSRQTDSRTIKESSSP